MLGLCMPFRHSVTGRADSSADRLVAWRTAKSVFWGASLCLGQALEKQCTLTKSEGWGASSLKRCWLVLMLEKTVKMTKLNWSKKPSTVSTTCKPQQVRVRSGSGSGLRSAWDAVSGADRMQASSDDSLPAGGFRQAAAVEQGDVLRPMMSERSAIRCTHHISFISYAASPREARSPRLSVHGWTMPCTEDGVLTPKY